MFASVQLDKKISCLFGKAPNFAAKQSCVEGQPKTSVTSAASVALEGYNARQRQLLAATRRAVLPIRASPRSASLGRYRSPTGSKAAAEACRFWGTAARTCKYPRGERAAAWMAACFCTENRWKRARDWAAEYHTSFQQDVASCATERR